MIDNLRHARVSVVMCTYNGEAFLREQLRSILSQTYPVYEVIVFDDCSSDKTELILREFCRDYPQVRYKRNEVQLGVRANFAAVIREAKGDYIACCDQDDLWVPSKIERLLSVLLENNASLVHSDADLIDTDGNKLGLSMFSYYKFDELLSLEDYILRANNVTGCTMLFSSSLRKYLYPFPENFYYHDRWIAIIACLHGKIVFCKESLTLYRQHACNLSATFGGGGMLINQHYFVQKAKGLWFIICNYRRLRYANGLLPLLLKDCLFAILGLSLLKEKWKTWVRLA